MSNEAIHAIVGPPDEDPKDLRNALIEDLKRIAIGGDKRAANLLLVIDVKGFSLQFGQVVNDNGKMFIVKLVGHNDRLLEKWGARMGLPRGCQMIWNRITRTIVFGGFMCKFGNDSTSDTYAADVCRAVIALKVSGFLGQLIAWVGSGGRVYFFGCCKNSVVDGGNGYVDQVNTFAAELVRDNPGLPARMVEDGFQLCFEVLAPWDPHGAFVNGKGGLVGTAIMHTQTFGDESEPTYASGMLPGLARMPPLEAREIFMALGVMVLGHFEIRSRPAILEVVALLKEHRATMSNSSLEALLRACDLCEFFPGNCTHDMLYVNNGEVLEGVVIAFLHASGAVLVQKLKFLYVWRTMWLREFIRRGGPPSDLVQFCERWTSGDQPWAPVMLRLIIEAGVARIPEFKARMAAIEDEKERAAYLRGMHVHIADAVAPDGASLLKFKELALQEIAQPIVGNTSKRLVVIAVCGPNGYGKTTTAAAVKKRLGEKGVDATHINGDILDLPGGIGDVMKIGKSRTDVTIYQVVLALMRGQVPVICCSFQLKDFRRRMAAMLPGISVELRVCIPTCMDDAYDPEAIRRSLAGRGTFTKAVDAKLLKPDYIDKHRDAAEALAAEARYTYPYGSTHEEHTPEALLEGVCADLAGNDDRDNNEMLLRHTWNGLLAYVPGVDDRCKHVTFRYDPGQTVPVDTLDEIQAFAGTTVKGTVWYGHLTDQGKAKIVFIAVHGMPPTVNDGCAHVTINSGPCLAGHMKTATRAVLGGETQVTLPTTDGANATFTLRAGKSVDVQLWTGYAT